MAKEENKVEEQPKENEILKVVREEYEKKIEDLRKEYEEKLKSQEKQFEEKRIADIKALISGRQQDFEIEKKKVEEPKSYFETELDIARKLLKL